MRVTLANGISMTGALCVLATITAATIQVPLPAAATNVSFPDSAERFVRTPAGFVDTAALVPGQDAGQIVVKYILPYQPGLTYSYSAPWPTGGINFLLDVSSGLTAKGDKLIEQGVQTMGDGSQFALLKHAALQLGEQAALTLSEELQLKAPPGQSEAQALPATAQSAAMTGARASETPGLPLAIGGLLIGLLLVVVGVWWFRRPEPALAEISDESTYKDLLTQIALLDDAHERGEVEETVYQARRSELFQLARVLIKPGEPS